MEQAVSIPGNVFTVVPDTAQFIDPYSDVFEATRMRCRGGLAIGDAFGGRDIRNWVVEYNQPTISVFPEGQPVAFTLSVSGVETVSLAFDNNMGITLAWQIGTTSSLYYFDSLAANYITRDFIDTTSCRVCVDDERDFSNASSDVIFAYTKTDNTVCWRQQRDRYDIERIVGTSAKRIFRLGPNQKRRLQFELR